MISLFNDWIEKVQQKKKSIILPEYKDDRLREAFQFIIKNRLVSSLVLVGDESEVFKFLQLSREEEEYINVLDPLKDSYREEMIQWVKNNFKKLMDDQMAEAIVNNPIYYAAFCLKYGKVDGFLGGANSFSSDVFRAVLKIIWLREGIQSVSGCFIMNKEEHKTLLFGDCAVIPEPTAVQLGDIAIEMTRTYRNLINQEEPSVALMSFSTKGSASSESTQRVVEAVELLKQKNVDFIFDGELQFDTAFVPSVAQKKAAQSKIQGNANCFVFPSLDAGNIGYKIAERMGGYEALGPIVQGLKLPYNDLSRGCNVSDIIKMIAITLLQ